MVFGRALFSGKLAAKVSPFMWKCPYYYGIVKSLEAILWRFEPDHHLATMEVDSQSSSIRGDSAIENDTEGISS